jgi:3-oxoacyl-[acyl-carrier-protein] synthase-3
VLVIGADFLSRFTDPDDRRTAALFGDGAGAVLLCATEDSGRVGRFTFGTDGGNASLIMAGRTDSLIRMQGQDTFKHAVARLAQATEEATAAAELPLAEVDLFVYHQANGRILRAVGERLGLDPGRVIDCVDRYGNTSAASIPIALAVAAAEDRLRPGARVLLAAFGAGLTWAGVVVEWGAS